MLSETPSGATAACRAAELVWGAADFDRPREMRLRGWRSRLTALVACLLVCLLAIVFVLWIRTAPVAMLHHHKPGARGQAGRRPRRRPSTRTAMLAVPGKSSGKYGATTILCYAASFSKRCSSKHAQWRAGHCCHGSDCAPEAAPMTFVPLRIVVLCSRLVDAV